MNREDGGWSDIYQGKGGKTGEAERSLRTCGHWKVATCRVTESLEQRTGRIWLRF